MLRTHNRICCTQVTLLLFSTLFLAATADNYDKGKGNAVWYGEYIGSFTDVDGGSGRTKIISGDVYLINATHVQILDFSYKGDWVSPYFWLDESETLTGKGMVLPMERYQYDWEAKVPYSYRTHMVLGFHDARKLDIKGIITNYRSLGVFDHRTEKPVAVLSIARNLEPPQIDFLLDGFNQELEEGYPVQTGPVIAWNRRTIKIMHFTFNARDLPSTFFYVSDNDNPKDGIKVPVRNIKSLGGQNFKSEAIMLDLPIDFDIYRVKTIGIYIPDRKKTLAVLQVSHPISPRIAPYVPPTKKPPRQWPNVTFFF